MSLRRLATGALALLTAAVGVTVPAGSATAAVDANDFDPGMIMTDALFYDSNAMTAAEIQTFLNAKVPTCEPWRDSDPDDITCMKDYRTAIESRSANANCKAISAQSNATAAEVINVVARACGISQKVLLVILQKEQGLVTHTWPSSYRYDIAMGYGCPDDDSGCKARYYGFFKQLYTAAWQFQQYKANPSSYSYRAGRTNSIQYHPDTDCGSDTVYIENQATAGLYIYTPYVPNQAALDGWPGQGNGCSSYGNRNFFMFYSDWFGPTTGYPVHANLKSAYESYGGLSVVGEALSPATSVSANGGGIVQRFAKGTMYRTSSGIVTYRGKGWAISTAYDAAGGPSGAWGWPITDSVSEAGIPVVEFQKVRVALIGGDVVTGHPFSDVSARTASYDYSEHAEAIFWMASEGISLGWEGTLGAEYRPRQKVSRDAMAAFLYRYEGATHASPATPTFVDVSADSSEFYVPIEWLAANGLAQGWETPSGLEYRPLRAMSRDAMAAFLFRLAAPEDYVPPASSYFVDVTPTNSEFYTEISWMYEQGLSTGWETSKGREYRPLNAVTRDAMASFLYRFDQAQAG
ncbi:MAG: LGFP repeat-containing protein [Actinomycetes bacterium]